MVSGIGAMREVRTVIGARADDCGVMVTQA